MAHVRSGNASSVCEFIVIVLGALVAYDAIFSSFLCVYGDYFVAVLAHLAGASIVCCFEETNRALDTNFVLAVRELKKFFSCWARCSEWFALGQVCVLGDVARWAALAVL